MDLDLLAAMQPNQRSIAVDTHLGNPIRNQVSPAITQAGIRKYQLLRRRHSTWRPRKPATGRYNCFGMLFASRRTSIDDDNEVRKALTEDGYRTIPLNQVDVGDIALYLEIGRGVLLHGGLVTRVSTMLGGGSAGIPYVLSKWDDVCGEDEHHFQHVPWDQGTWRVEFWTDR